MHLAAEKFAERRTHIRAPSTFSVEIIDPLSGEPRRESSCNISVGGIYIVTDAPVTSGAMIDLKILIPNQAPIVCTGLVVHSGGSPSGMGVRFETMMAIDLGRIRAFVNLHVSALI